jgi:2'-5' RNA ligase
VSEAELRSALIIAVPEAAAAVDEWRDRTSRAKPSNGVPAHITILFPFAPADSIDDSLVASLRALFSTLGSFEFELRETRHSPGVLYLAPEPAEPFVRLTETVWAAHPEFPPYRGAFDSIVPHLTAAEGDHDTLRQAEAEIATSLPISARATEAILIEEFESDSARWRTRGHFPFGRSW